MSLESAVEKCHWLRRGDKDALHATVMKVWKDVASEEAFVKVFERLNKNYIVIEKSQGSNDYCEEFQGKKGMEDIAAYDFVGADMEVGELVTDGGVDDVQRFDHAALAA